MNSFKLSKIVKVKSQFGRSVNLERDFHTDIDLDGYVLTTTALKNLERIQQAILNDSSSRAWTLTGPFGSGKSAFALFVAKLLDTKMTSGRRTASKLLKNRGVYSSYRALLGSDLSSIRFVPILVSGARESLAGAILRGIKTTVETLDRRAHRAHLRELAKLEISKNVTGKEILSLLQSISQTISKSVKRKIGILLVIDELGKLLEYAAINRSESDIFLLQELAEGTRKSATPLLLITILHQAFERYAERLGKRDRDEWTKVQGRFEDITFQEPNEQTLQILRSVFDRTKKSNAHNILSDRGNSLAKKAFDLGLCGSLKKDAITLLRDCAPLHPLVAFLLGTIFRRFGQNERSLFAFLTSGEPFGFSDLISRTTWTDEDQEVVRLDNIYDYLVSAMGSALLAGPEGRKWAEVESALQRVPDASLLETRILKTIGLFYLLGDLGRFKCSREILYFSLAERTTNAKQIDLALERLRRKSVVTERRFNDTIVVWEGSDVDLDARFADAEKIIDKNTSLAENLRLYFSQRPIVAKRHSSHSGTLRFFDITYINASDSDTKRIDGLTKADGQIVFALAANDEEIGELECKIERGQIKTGLQTIIAIPKNLGNLRDAIWRAICWRWVSSNTPQLENDRAARKELAVRLLHSEQAVSEWLDDWQGYGSDVTCTWYWRGQKSHFSSPRAFQDFLSSVFDHVFSATPILKNELVNRSVLSSAAASARRSLFEAMLSNPDKPQLAITGFPPQLSMYFSVFQETSIHREEAGKYGFYPPIETADSGIRAVWAEIEAFLEKTERQRLTIADLFETLQKPPFGLKSGVLPLLTVSVFLYLDSQVALYERGNFVSKLTLPVLERLCRAPESFAVQLCRISGVRSEVISKMADTLLPGRAEKGRAEILTVVRPLVRFAQELVEYSQHTTRISPLARNIRRALFSAREPDKLLFKLLPEACGLPEFRNTLDGNDHVVDKFSEELGKGLAELKRSYDELLNEIESLITSAFSLSISPRENLRLRCKAVAEFAASVKLKGFILRASDPKLETIEWLESVGAQLAGKPPAFWRDEDLANFELSLTDTARSFMNLESLVFERLGGKKIGTDIELIRMNLAQLNRDERSQVLSIRLEEKEIVEEAKKLLLSAFEQSHINGNLNLRLATLAHLSLDLLKEKE